MIDCDLNLYFNRQENSKEISISLLVLDHIPSTEEINEAIIQMEGAKKGEYQKRKPITVQKFPGGKYKVIDGNTTTTVLKDWGFTHVIAMEIKE